MSDDDHPAPGRGLEDTTSPRLSLRSPTADEVPELFEALYSDPLTWRLDPTLRHASTADTAARVQREVTRWDTDGLATWVARLLGGEGAGELVGVGGCELPTDRAWNLSFRVRPRYWGQGYAQEVAAAGIAAARRTRPGLPVTAVVTEANTPSQRVLGRVGLSRVWRGPDPKAPGASTALLLYADRELAEDLVRALTT